MAYHLKGEQETARHHFTELLNSSESDDSPNSRANALRLVFASVAYMYLGNSESALAASQKAVDLLPVEEDHIFGANYAKNHTWILAMAGRHDEALDRLAANIDGPGGFSRWELHLDPTWDFFRDDPRFVALATPKGESQ